MTFSSIDDLVDLYRQFGYHMYDEEISQTTHGVQCARRAQKDQAPNELVLAALVHDVGHLLEIRTRQSGEVITNRDLRHQDTGADALGLLFSEKVTEPIRWHVEAKRYLCATDSIYAKDLSAGSIASLKLQGGAMSDQECGLFLAQAQSTDAIRLRRWDDLGKDVDDVAVSIKDFELLLRTVVSNIKN